MTEHASQWVWTPDGLRRDLAVQVNDEGRVVGFRAAPGAPPGLLLPGLVNAHLHLELSELRGRIPGGNGAAAWATLLLAARRAPDPAAMEAAALELAQCGVVGVVDVSNSGATGPALAAAGLRGAILVEALGLDAERWLPALARAGELLAPPGFTVRATAHAALSCAPELLRLVLAGPGPVTVHCDEDEAEGQLLDRRLGPWRELRDRLEASRAGPPWTEVLGRAPTATALLDRLGLLGPHLGLVHMVAAREEDLDRVAAAGARIVLCPRSNLFVSLRLPPVAAMVARGIPLAIGTDSLASVADLDPLADAALLARTWPLLARETWVRALTEGGAALVGDPDLGRIAPGTRPGLVRAALPATEDPLHALLSGQRWRRDRVA